MSTGNPRGALRMPRDEPPAGAPGKEPLRESWKPPARAPWACPLLHLLGRKRRHPHRLLVMVHEDTMQTERIRTHDERRVKSLLLVNLIGLSFAT